MTTTRKQHSPSFKARVDAGANRFSFVHRTFLEYFCAAWFVERFEKKQTLTLEEMKTDVFGPHWKDESWHEVLRLIAGMVGEKQAEELILFLIAQDAGWDNLANLALAAECLGEVRNRRTIRKTDEAIRAEILGRGIRYEPLWYSESWEEYSPCWIVREKFMSLLAVLWRNAATRQWLCSAAEGDSDWIVRAAAVRELARGWKDEPDTLLILKERASADEDSDVRAAALRELARGWKDEPDTLPTLKECARPNEDPYVRGAALQELARGWKDDPEVPIILKVCARADHASYARAAAVQGLEGRSRDRAPSEGVRPRRSEQRRANGGGAGAGVGLEGRSRDPALAEGTRPRR